MGKILVPLNDKHCLKPFINAGADEFYIGFYDDAWLDMGKFAEINRMSGFREHANRYNFEEMLDVIGMVKEMGKDIYVTLNSPSYSQQQLLRLEKYMSRISQAGANGVIVSTPEMVQMAKRHGMHAVASTMCGIYNRDIASLYRKIGCERIILPRDVSLSEIQSITENTPNTEFEVFIMRNGCHFSDSFCLGFHRPERGVFCAMLNNNVSHIYTSNSGFKMEHDMELNNWLYKQIFHLKAACGMCALYQFENMGIKAYKIVGRADDSMGVLNDIRIIKNNINIANSCSSEEEYLKNMIRVPNSYEACKLGLGCYYPEVRF